MVDVGIGGWSLLAMRDEQGEDRAVLELTPQGAPQGEDVFTEQVPPDIFM